MIMKGFVRWNFVYGYEDFTSSEDRTRSARSVGQRLTHWATEVPYTFKTKNIFLMTEMTYCMLANYFSDIVLNSHLDHKVSTVSV